MKHLNGNINGLVPISRYQSMSIIGGWDGIRNETVSAIGQGIGFGMKKIWKGFKFLSANLMYQQRMSQIIYK